MKISYKISSFSLSSSFIVGILLLLQCSKPLNFSENTPCNDRLEAISKEFERERFVDIREPLNQYIISCANEDKLDYAYYVLAESYYHLEDWSLAELEYRALLSTFPNSQYQEDVFYKMTQTFFNQKMSWDRDQDKTYLALQSHRNFLSDYPASDYVLKVRKNILELRKDLAKRELKIAQLYQHFDLNLSAILYYKSFLEEFIDLADESNVYYNIAKCYVKAKQFIQAIEYLSLAENKNLSPSLAKALKNDIKEYKQEKQTKKDKAILKQYFERL